MQTSAALAIRLFVTGFWCALLLEQAGARNWLGLPPAQGPEPGSPAAFIGLVAPAFFLWCLWAASNVLSALGRGEAFATAIRRGLLQVGAGLMLGGWGSILVQSGLLPITGDDLAGTPFGATIEHVILGLAGLALIALALQARSASAEPKD